MIMMYSLRSIVFLAVFLSFYGRNIALATTPLDPFYSSVESVFVTTLLENEGGATADVAAEEVTKRAAGIVQTYIGSSFTPVKTVPWLYSSQAARSKNIVIYILGSIQTIRDPAIAEDRTVLSLAVQMYRRPGVGFYAPPPAYSTKPRVVLLSGDPRVDWERIDHLLEQQLDLVKPVNQ